MREVRWIFVHTAAHSGTAGVEEIRDWHTSPDPNDPSKPWSDIGYHYVVRRDGTVEEGRPEGRPGAHVFGANRESLGICCEGHGDLEPQTPEQRGALLALCHDLMKQHGVPVEGVLGHREVNDLVDAGELPALIQGSAVQTGKTCPGTKVDMDEIRARLATPHALPVDDVWPIVDPVDSTPWVPPTLYELGEVEPVLNSSARAVVSATAKTDQRYGDYLLEGVKWVAAQPAVGRFLGKLLEKLAERAMRKLGVANG